MMVSGFNWSPAGQRLSRGWATFSGHDETLGCRRLAYRAQVRNWSLNQGIDFGRSVPGALIGGAAEITRAFGVEHGTVNGARSHRFGSISIVAVIPITSRTSAGTLSISMCTGMRWAKRTQVKIGLTVASPLLPGMTLDTTMPRAMLSTCPFSTSR